MQYSEACDGTRGTRQTNVCAADCFENRTPAVNSRRKFTKLALKIETLSIYNRQLYLVIIGKFSIHLKKSFCIFSLTCQILWYMKLFFKPRISRLQFQAPKMRNHFFPIRLLAKVVRCQPYIFVHTRQRMHEILFYGSYPSV